MRWIVALLMCIGLASMVQAQTETPTSSPTPTVTPTPTPEPYTYATLAPESTDEPGQMTRFDYVVTVGEVQVSNLLTLQLFSQWGMFLFALLLFWRRRRRR